MDRTRGSRCSLANVAPATRSAWPPQYLVSATTLMSTSISNGRSRPGEPQVLSIAVVIRRPVIASPARAAATMAGTSWTSNVWVPGLSIQIAAVVGRISSAMPAPMSGS